MVLLALRSGCSVEATEVPSCAGVLLRLAAIGAAGARASARVVFRVCAAPGGRVKLLLVFCAEATMRRTS